MARETKVGLIVGLGVILFVSVFVSDYLSDPVRDESFVHETGHFDQQTTNQPPLPEAGATETPAPLDTRALAAASLEQAERRDGSNTQIRSDIPDTAPPIRRGPPSLATEDVETPEAFDPYRTPGSAVGTHRVDDRLAERGHQLSPDRLHAGNPIDEEAILRVPINPEPILTPPAQQIRHTVKAGETLSKIARKYYDGDYNMWRSIRDANPGIVGANGEVAQNAVLVIPKRSTETAEEFVEVRGGAAGAAVNPRTRVRVVTVQAGDSLSKLAAKHLGSARDWRKIMAVNEDLEKPEHITVGMKLYIPVDDTEMPTRESESTATERGSTEREQPVSESNGRTYVVKAGDNLYRIATNMLGDGERYKEIYEANRDKLSSPNAIRPGMTLKLPAAN